MSIILQNENPIIYNVSSNRVVSENFEFDDEIEREFISIDEIFDIIRHINDPEHALTLEQLNVLKIEDIEVNDDENEIIVKFTPTIPHCSMATLIGLCIRVKLTRSLPSRFKFIVQIHPGSHQSEEAVNKQLNDKERVAAAFENNHLINIVNNCLLNSDR
eukprot:gene16867-23120_t